MKRRFKECKRFQKLGTALICQAGGLCQQKGGIGPLALSVLALVPMLMPMLGNGTRTWGSILKELYKNDKTKFALSKFKHTFGAFFTNT